MTLPEHLFIGLSVGNIYYSIQAFFNKKYVPYLMIIFFAGLLSIIPDIDSFFGNYTSTNVYAGHRGITHSILFIAILSAALVLLIFTTAVLINFLFNNNDAGSIRTKCIIIFFIMFVSGLSHLLADLPQPPGAWGGIPLFFPCQSGDVFARTGGWSKTGWYDLRILWSYAFIILLSALLIIALKILDKFKPGYLKKTAAVILLAVNISINIWTIFYINNSKYQGHHQWERIQHEYLEDHNPLIKGATEKGKQIYLKLFHSIK